MRFAREGLPFMWAAGVIALSVGAAAFRWPRPLLIAAAVVSVLLAVWVAYFFRDPERQGERGPRVVIAPADGKVVQVMEVDEPAFMHGRAIRIAIFMNVFSVHVNRYPVSGRITYTHYNPGKFLNAAVDKASLENEQSSVGIESGPHRVLVRQIAGLVARRIVTYSRPGDQADQGERFGIIRFGSRVDVYLPVGSTPRVRVGEHTSAGTTVIAGLP
ncbi:MAG: phosphatidylserine decarboxylase family protein [Gemmatimonadaceae bacterium]|nr:phosphatidylserine decarboxylase family protein [Gemmatimonadaceae bacterium]